MKKGYLGEFEELVLTIVIILENEAYGNTIVEAIKNHQDRVVSLSAVHITLYRLEEKGYLKSETGGATQQRGGRRKRYFRVTNDGLALIRELKASRNSLWNLSPLLQFAQG